MLSTQQFTLTSVVHKYHRNFTKFELSCSVTIIAHSLCVSEDSLWGNKHNKISNHIFRQRFVLFQYYIIWIWPPTYFLLYNKTQHTVLSFVLQSYPHLYANILFQTYYLLLTNFQQIYLCKLHRHQTNWSPTIQWILCRVRKCIWLNYLFSLIIK